MKKYSKFIFPAIILALIVVSVVVNYQQNKQSSDLTGVEISDSAQACYLYEKEADLGDIPGGPYFDREYIQFSSLDDVTVTGTHNILPAERDSNRATFIGVQQDGYLNVIATATAEGTTWQEQRLYQVVGDKLFVGYQEIYVPQYQDEKGIYFYEDLSKISFETEEFFLNKIDCSAIPENTKI